MRKESNKTLSILTKIFEEVDIPEESKEYLTKIAKTNLSVHKELLMYRSILSYVNFEKIKDAIGFMSTKEIYLHYVTKSKAFAVTALQNDIQTALKSANEEARKDCLYRYPDLVNDESISLNRCSTASERIDFISEFIISEISDKIRINPILGLMMIESIDVSKNKKVETIKGYSAESLARLIYALLYREVPYDEILKVTKKIELNSVLYSKESTIIQMPDCYVEDGLVKKGFYTGESLPKFYVDRSAYDSVKAGKPVHYCKAVDDLLDHLSNFNQQTRGRFVALLSTIFFNNEDLKNEFNHSLRIYGKDGRNGKSLFSNLLQRAFGPDNCQIFSIADLNDPKTMYAVANSLVAIDSDSSGKTISEDAAATFKSLTSGERVQIKGLYQKATTIETSCSIIAFSNVLPSSSDKSNAYLRRLEIMRSDYQILSEDEEVGANSKRTLIEIDDDWFKELRSPEASQYLYELLLVESQRVIKTKTLPEKSEDMKDLLHRFAEDNDSASAFVHEVGLENIIGFTINEVKEKYQTWCEENDMTELKRKFKQILSEQFGLDTVMTSNHELISQSSSSYALVYSKTKHAVRVWRYKSEEKTEEFLKSLLKE